MKTLKANELEVLQNFKAWMSAEGARVQQILNDADVFGTATDIFLLCQDIEGRINSIMEDNAKQTENNKYLGDYKGTLMGDYKGTLMEQELFITVKSCEPDEDGDTYYYGKQSVYIGGKSFERDFVCDLKTFQGAVEAELYKRIE